MSAVVSPFPFASLERVSHGELRRSAALRRAARLVAPHEKVARALGEIVGDEVRVLLRRSLPLDVTKIPGDAIAIALSPSDAAGMSGAILVEAEGALALSVVAKALQHRAPRVVDASRAPSPAVAGALAAIVLAAVRRAHADTPLRVVAAGPAAALARDLASSHPKITTAWLTVTVGAEAHDARIEVPDDLPLPTNESLSDGAAALSGADLAALGDLPLALPVVVATCLATRHDLRSLERGDAFVLPSFALRVDPASQLLAGPVVLVAPSAEQGLAAALDTAPRSDGATRIGGEVAETGRLVLRGQLEARPWEDRTGVEDDAMPEADQEQTNTTAVAIEDVPVVVRVELGTVEMKAHEWAALASGDVLSIGRKLGAPALLRVGGVEVARGELVQVDGEYGVRILSRTPSDSKGSDR